MQSIEASISFLFVIFLCAFVLSSSHPSDNSQLEQFNSQSTANSACLILLKKQAFESRKTIDEFKSVTGYCVSVEGGLSNCKDVKPVNYCATWKINTLDGSVTRIRVGVAKSI